MLREWFYELIHHRKIIRELRKKIKNIEIDVPKILEMLYVYHCEMSVKQMETSFYWDICIRKNLRVIDNYSYARFSSSNVIPPTHTVEDAIEKLLRYEEKKKKAKE